MPDQTPIHPSDPTALTAQEAENAQSPHSYLSAILQAIVAARAGKPYVARGTFKAPFTGKAFSYKLSVVVGAPIEGANLDPFQLFLDFLLGFETGNTDTISFNAGGGDSQVGIIATLVLQPF